MDWQCWTLKKARDCGFYSICSSSSDSSSWRRCALLLISVRARRLVLLLLVVFKYQQFHISLQVHLGTCFFSLIKVKPSSPKSLNTVVHPPFPPLIAPGQAPTKCDLHTSAFDPHNFQQGLDWTAVKLCQHVGSGAKPDRKRGFIPIRGSRWFERCRCRLTYTQQVRSICIIDHACFSHIHIVFGSCGQAEYSTTATPYARRSDLHQYDTRECQSERRDTVQGRASESTE